MSDLNTQQARVAEDPTGGLFVSAGAGTGKTRAVAHRFGNAVRLARDEGARRPCDSALAITFTEKAAWELAERIRRVLLAAREPALARASDSGWISTIHGFCSRVLRRYAIDAGVAPDFSVLDETRATLLAREVFDEAAARSANASDEVARLLEAYGHATVREGVIGTLEHLSATGAELSTLRPPDGGLGVAELEEFAAVLEELAAHFGALGHTTNTVEANRAALLELAAFLREAAASEFVAPEICAAVSATRISSRGSAEAKALAQDAKLAVERLRQLSVEADVSTFSQAFLDLLEAFAVRYRRAKEEKGLLDFADLPLLTVRLLERRPDIAHELADGFSAVIVDEYQDTDPLQTSIVERVSAGGLCTVGDAQQSIYSWRFADVEVFRRRRDRVNEGDRTELTVNYRSHPDIVGFVNHAFSHAPLASADHLTLVAERSAADLGALPNPMPRVRLDLVSDTRDEADPRETEAAVMAARVRGLLDDGVAPGDIAVLFRRMTKARVYIDALREWGVDAFVESGIQFFGRPEVEEVLALLRLVVNPRDDEAALASLCGRAAGLGDEAVLALKRAAGDEPLWSALARAGDAGLTRSEADAAKRLKGSIAEARASQGRRSVGRLITDLVVALDLDLVLASEGPVGERGLANVRKLARMADEVASGFEQLDVASFLSAISDRSDVGDRERPGVVAADVDAVRVMTVYAAKGLEFPVVFLPDLGRKTWVDRARPFIVVDEDDGPVLAMRGPKPRERKGNGPATALHADACSTELDCAVDEEKRVLYVGCTRARDLLVLSGVADTQSEPGEELAVDWVRAAIGSSADDGPPHDDGPRVLVEVHEPGELGTVPPARAGDGPLDPASISDAAAAVPAGTDRGASAPESIRRATPLTVSYTALETFTRCPYKHYATRVLGLASPRRQGPSAADIGAEVHRRLFARLEGMARDAPATRTRGLGPDELLRVESAVDGFMGSPLAGELLGHDRVTAEMPFAVPVSETLLVGAMDAVGTSDTRALVVDYKTGEPISGPGPALEKHLLQASCYAFATLTAGAERVDVAFAYVEHDAEPVRFSFTEEDRSHLLRELEERVGRISDGPFPPLGAYDPLACGDCPACGGICPVSPPRRRSRS